jgi:hypothetical protein
VTVEMAVMVPTDIRQANAQEQTDQTVCLMLLLPLVVAVARQATLAQDQQELLETVVQAVEQAMMLQTVLQGLELLDKGTEVVIVLHILQPTHMSKLVAAEQVG